MRSLVSTFKKAVVARPRRVSNGWVRCRAGSSVRGGRRIRAGRHVAIGSLLEFSSRRDATVIDVDGALTLGDFVRINAGARLTVASEAVCSIGAGTFVNADTLLFVRDSLSIGTGCAISWRCTVMDTDHHQLDYLGRVDRSGVIIGDRVWVGAGATILAGTTIANGCVIAAGTVVRGDFLDEDCLIAGSPARVVRRNVEWRL